MDYHSPVLSLQRLNREQRIAHVKLLTANGKNGPRGLQLVVSGRACVISLVISRIKRPHNQEALCYVFD